MGGQLDSAMDSTKQKGQVNTMRKQRAELVAQLGESLLEQFRQQNVNAEQLRPEVDGIFSLERQIIEAEQQMEAQKQAAAQAKAQQGPPAAPGPQVSSGPPPAPPAPPLRRRSKARRHVLPVVEKSPRVPASALAAGPSRRDS